MSFDLSPTPAQEHEARKWVIIVYVLQILSLFIGITSIIGIIINYIKLDDVRGTWLESHFRWQMRTFWFSLLWAVLGGLTFWFGVGIVVWIVAGIWGLYRIIKGAIVYKTALLLPYAVAPAVAGVLWMFMFSPSLGVVAYLLRQSGFDWNHLLKSDHAIDRKSVV